MGKLKAKAKAKSKIKSRKRRPTYEEITESYGGLLNLGTDLFQDAKIQMLHKLKIIVVNIIRRPSSFSSPLSLGEIAISFSYSQL